MVIIPFLAPSLFTGKNMKNLFLFLIVFSFLFGCAPKKKEIIIMKRVGLPEKQAEETGKHKILVGMSQEDVRKALGSPNIVARDKSGKEIWVMGPLATSITDIKKNGKPGILVKKADIPGKKKETSQSRKKLLSIVIHFDRDKNVESLSYN